jgi:hypothetical protein
MRTVEPGSEALGVELATQLGLVHQDVLDPHLSEAFLLLDQLVQVALFHGQRRGTGQLELAVHTVVVDEGSDLLQPEPCGVVVLARRLGTSLVVDGLDSRQAQVRESAVAPARPVAAARPLQQHDALAGQAARQVVGRRHAGEAPADDSDIHALSALERRVDPSVVHFRRLEPVVVDEVLVELRGPVRILREHPARHHPRCPHARAARRRSGQKCAP